MPEALCKAAAEAGYEFTPRELEEAVKEADTGFETAATGPDGELPDESLEQVNGGFFIGVGGIGICFQHGIDPAIQCNVAFVY